MKTVTIAGGREVSKRGVKLRRKRQKAANLAKRLKKGSFARKVVNSRRSSLDKRVKESDRRTTKRLNRR